MRKTLSLFALLAIFSSTTINAQVSTTINSSASTPVIDGINTDPIWSTLTANSINRVFASETIDDADDLSGHWKALYDDDGIYILVEVTADDILFTSAGNFWENDLIELCFDMNVGDLTDGQGVQHNDGHYQLFINRENLVEVISDGTWRDGVHVGVSLNTTDNTSIHEYYIPWANIPSGDGSTFTPNASDQIGFDASITDNDDDGTGRNRMAWGNDGANDENWNNMDDAGRLSFGVGVTPSISMTDDGSIVEGSEDGEVITITLSNDTFVSTLTPSNWTISNQPSGVSLGALNRVNETTVTITLSGNTNIDYDTDINNFTVNVAASEFITSTADLTIMGGVSFTPKYKAPRSYRIEYDGEIIEGAEDGEQISVILTSCEYINAPKIQHWVFYNFPLGVVAEDLVRVNDTTVTFTLNGNSTLDYDNDITDSYIRINYHQLKDTIALPNTSSRIVFTANKEKNLSLHAMEELILNNEDGAQILAIVENDTFNSTLTTANWQLTGVPAEITISNIERQDKNSALLTLSGNSPVPLPYNISITASADEFYPHANSISSLASIPVGINHIHNIDVSGAHTMNDELAQNYLIDQCYEVLRWKMGSVEQNWGASFYMLANIASDNMVKGGGNASDTPSYEAIDSLSIKPENDAIQALWEKYFTGIIRCNTLLEHIEPGTTNTDRMISEAKFLRAYFYFHLVRVFGDVPLIYSSCYTPFSLPERNTSSEVYEFLKLELSGTIADLPLKSELIPSEKARITKGAARTLLAKVNLYTEDWSEVTTALDALISSSEYSLLADYDSLWFENKEHNEESIFEISYTDTLSAEWDGASEPGNVDVQFMGIYSLSDSDGNFSNGWGFCKVTSDMVSKYIAANDTIRLQASVLFADSINGSFTDNYDYTGYYNKKYAARTQFFPQNSTMWGQNEIKYRYAEVLLMYAEASYHLNNEPDAINYLNMLRSRVNLPAISGVSGQALLDTIYAERRLEMAFESNRYFDLVRWGQAEDAYVNENYNPITNGLWPIPERVFENSKIFTQNAGYEHSTDQFNPEVELTGFVDRIGSPRATTPYFNRKHTIDSLVSYGLSTCSTFAQIEAKRIYEYTDSLITSEKEWKYDQVNEKWVNKNSYSYVYDDKGNLTSEFRQLFSENPYTTERVYTYDDNNYLETDTYNDYTYGTVQYSDYSWSTDYSSFSIVNYYGSVYSLDSKTLVDSSRTEVTIQADTITESVTKYKSDGSIRAKAINKFLPDGSFAEFFEVYYNDYATNDTSWINWDKYIVVKDADGNITKFTRLDYNSDTRKLDTIETEYNGFNDDLSFKTTVSYLDYNHDHYCNYRAPGSITRYFNSEKSVCTDDSTTITEIICQGSTFEGFSSTGTYFITEQNIAGCDSIITLHLTVLSNDTTFYTESICAGEEYRGYSETGKYTKTFSSINGCDSIVITDLTVHSKDTLFITESICAGELFRDYTETGIYTETFSSINGCDSLVITDLTVLSNDTIFFTESICAGEEYRGFSETGEYTETFSSINGCDSLVITNLTVHSNDTLFITESICAGELFRDYTETGIYTETFSSINGCDSLVITDLTVNEMPVPNLGKDSTIYTDQELNLDAGKFTSYEWSTLETTQSITIVGANYTDGDTEEISVLVTDANSCTNSDTILISIKKNEELASKESELSYTKVFPNPSIGRFTIKLSQSRNNISILIYSETGNMIKSFDDFDSDIIEVDDLKPGVYNLQIKSDTEIHNQRIIVK